MNILYTVRAGDTLYTIGRKLGSSPAAIMAANRLASTVITPGQRLTVPVAPLPQGVFGPGSRGEGVRALQQALIRMGFSLAPTGFYDTDTAFIVASIQKKYPELLEIDGFYGPKTRAVLQKLIDEGYSIVENPSSILVLVNKRRALPPSYVPENLVYPVFPSGEDFIMREDAAKAIRELYNAAAADNISLFGVSGYRSYNRQADFFASRIRQNPDANRTTARPGESEHQTGLTADISSPSVNYALDESFAQSDAGRWLRENAPNSGFIIRYPRGKENITGYAYEPWHMRYVGKQAAQNIASRAITLEEYLGTAEQ